MRDKKKKQDETIFAEMFPRALHRGERTKLRLIEAGIEVLSTAGLEAFTFEEVGRRVGMNRAQVKYHFSDKNELLRRAFEFTIGTAQKQVLSEMERAGDWRSRIDAVIKGFFTWVRESPSQAAVLHLMYYISMLDPSMRNLSVAVNVMGDQRLQALLKLGQEARGWSDSDLEFLSEAVWAVTDGFVLYYLTGDRKDPRRQLNLALAATARLLDGLPRKTARKQSSK